MQAPSGFQGNYLYADIENQLLKTEVFFEILPFSARNFTIKTIFKETKLTHHEMAAFTSIYSLI